ncbi:MAG: hypothetical protein AB1430_06480 [Pseudomonadota bacterium]
MQQAALYLAALLLVGISVAHSYLGERYLLMRLFRRCELPKLFGSAEYTQRTLRFAWHVTSVAWLGFAALLMLAARAPLSTAALGWATAAVFGAHFAIALVGSRGRHYSWVVFLAVALLAVAALPSG